MPDSRDDEGKGERSIEREALYKLIIGVTWFASSVKR